MIRYVIVLLALNIYSCSLGASIMHNSLENLLNDLSSTCGNSFLSLQITERIKDCNVTVPPYGEKQLRCLMFYDISKRMCSVLSSKTSFNFTLTDVSNLKGNQSVSDLCNGTTKLWNFNNIAVYPKYKSEIESIQNNNVACYRICSENDLSSLNSNFYCKYYKWGSDFLRSMKTFVVDRKDTTNATIHNYQGLKNSLNVSPSMSAVKETHSLNKDNLLDLSDKTATLKQNKVKGYNLNANNAQEILPVQHSKNSVSNTSNQLALSESSINEKSTLSEVDKLSTTAMVKELNEYSNGTLKQETSTNPESKTTQKKELLSKLLKMYKEFKQESDVDGSTLNIDTIQPLPPGLNSSRNHQGIEKQQVPFENPSLPNSGLPQGLKVPSPKLEPDDPDVYESDPNVEAEVEQPPSFSPDDSLKDPDADEESDFSKDIEMKIDNSHDDASRKDPSSKDGVEPKNEIQEGKIEPPLSSLHGGFPQKGLDIVEGSDPKEQLKYTQTKIEAPLSSLHGDNSPREFSAQEQEGFAEEDDNFFPFFLTAIILVVLLYVFYHNKNRVLGLIVEGRQSNRRRNSRGHAYRRLDTLEQAMSGSSGATPPSKIIY